MKKLLVLLLFLTLIVSFAACGGPDGTTPADTSDGQPEEVTISVKVIHKDKSEKTFTITTSEKTLLGALQQESLVEGEDQSAGYYITSVDGETADWSVDQGWWCLKKDGSSLMTGADSTPIADKDSFEIVYTIG